MTTEIIIAISLYAILSSGFVYDFIKKGKRVR
jgi:hypothetical protein